jgi:hypothetical protein
MITRALSTRVLLPVVTLAFSACAAVMNPQMKDSATVWGTLSLLHPHEQTIVLRIDGLWGGITLKSERYVTPGKHELTVSTVFLADPDDDSWSSKTTLVDSVFQPNHRYIVKRTGNSLLLCDETAGDKNSILVGQWDIGVEDFYYEEPIDQADFIGADHVRPPLDRAKHASHSAGPPSIPHNPRPSPGSGRGGHGGGGGSHGGGGGGGGQKK